MSKVIAIVNQKGGVAKTTTAVNLGVGLATKGKKVLLIDADSQGDLTESLGFVNPDEMEDTLASVFEKLINDEEFNHDFGIIHHKEGVDLMPCNLDMAAVEVALVNVMSREMIMKSYIDIQREYYDVIIIDCMPSLGIITVNALAAADSVLIPVQATHLGAKGLVHLLKTVARVRKLINTKLDIEGILLTMVKANTNYSKGTAQRIEEAYGSYVKVFETQISDSTRAAEMTAEGVSIYSYDPRGKVASQYRRLVEEVLANEK